MSSAVSDAGTARPDGPAAIVTCVSPAHAVSPEVRVGAILTGRFPADVADAARYLHGGALSFTTQALPTVDGGGS